jgi:hypothetical protein
MSEELMVGEPPPGQMVEAPALDEIDRQIVEALTRDGRLSIRALADQVHISRANAYARVERLTTTGVITGFTATVDPLKLGLATSAYVTLSLRQSSWRTLREQLQAIPEVKHIALVGGDFDAIPAGPRRRQRRPPPSGPGKAPSHPRSPRHPHRPHLRRPRHPVICTARQEVVASGRTGHAQPSDDMPVRGHYLLSSGTDRAAARRAA